VNLEKEKGKGQGGRDLVRGKARQGNPERRARGRAMLARAAARREGRRTNMSGTSILLAFYQSREDATLAWREIRRQGVPAALVLGPTPGTDLAGHENEFRHAVSHLIADFSVRLSWVSFLSIKDPFGHLKACLDMEPGA